MHEMIQKYKENLGFINPDKITANQYLNEWLKEYAENNVSENTFYTYNLIVKKHLNPYLSRLKLSELQPWHIIKYQNDKLDHGKISNTEGLSKRSVQHHHRVLSQALKHVVHTYKILDNNPCNSVTAPSPDKPNIYPLTKQDAKKY